MSKPRNTEVSNPTHTKRWNAVEVFHDGDAFFAALGREISAATQSIFLESYIFATDTTGLHVLQMLADAVQRGVVVRIIIDGIGSHTWKQTVREYAVANGIQIKIFHELPWTRWWRGGRKQSGRRDTLWRVIQRVNNRNHRKVCVIDETRAFVGSMNIINTHRRSIVGEACWRDTGALLAGPEVSVLVDSFNDLWHRGGRGAKWRPAHSRAASGELVRLNLRRRQRRENYLDLLVRIVGSDRRVWIENAYFVPDGSLLRVLRVAAESGVDVKIVVPAYSDVVFIPWVASAFHLGLLEAGVRVFEYTKTVLHAKTMLIDDWGLVGSSNLNHRSLLHDLEADVVLADTAACASLEQQFLADCADSVEVTLENWHRRPWIERVIGRILLAVRHLL